MTTVQTENRRKDHTCTSTQRSHARVARIKGTGSQALPPVQVRTPGPGNPLISALRAASRRHAASGHPAPASLVCASPCRKSGALTHAVGLGVGACRAPSRQAGRQTSCWPRTGKRSPGARRSPLSTAPLLTDSHPPQSCLCRPTWTSRMLRGTPAQPGPSVRTALCPGLPRGK